MYTLEENGFTVVKGVLKDSEVKYAKEEFFKWYNGIEKIGVPPHGVIKHHQVGHQVHAWYIRTRPKVIEEFAKIWGTEELVVSFDGCCYIPKNLSRKDKSWVHTDQAPKQKGLQCVQGFIALTDNENTSFVVYDKTHMMHEKYFEEKNENHGKRWNLIDKNYVDQTARKVIKVNAGDLVLWDSRTFHENCYGRESEERLVQYICYLPKGSEKNTEGQKEKRKNYLETLRTTSHWPYPIQVNSMQPQIYGDESKKIDYGKLGRPELEEYMEEILKII
jgi:ectoine hydroxylase-related dioxygenase (phytanoyl-CoA dioxygenase family)